MRGGSVWTALMVLLGGAAAAGEEADIVGLRLGMTPAEAEAALRAYDPTLQIQPPVESALQYRVGDQTRLTERFLNYIFAVSGRPQKEDVYVYFSRPPGEPRVIAITRLHNNFDPPIPREAYLAALVEKYGEPDAAMRDAFGDEAQRIHWRQWHLGEGAAQCVRGFSGGRETEGEFAQLGVSAIERLEVSQRLVEGAEPARCAALLTYELAYDPVSGASGSLIDVAAAIRGEQALAAWIEELARQEAGGDGAPPAPRL